MATRSNAEPCAQSTVCHRRWSGIFAHRACIHDIPSMFRAPLSYSRARRFSPDPAFKPVSSPVSPKGAMMTHTTHPDVALNLALAVITASDAPALLLDQNFTIIAASTSFCRAFALDPRQAVGRTPLELGDGEWDVPQLRTLLGVTFHGDAQIESYE